VNLEATRQGALALKRAAEARAAAGARRFADFIDLQWSLVWSYLKEVAPLAKGRLLDVGCGDKPYEELFRPYVSDYIGVEYSETFELTSASTPLTQTSGERRRGPDVVYNGDRLPFPDGSFDTVLNVQVLEHTPRPGRLVAEMARVLAPGGTLILMAPFQFRLHEQPHDYFRFSPHGLRQLCKEAGLEVTRVEQMGSLWSLIGHKLNSYLVFRVGRFASLGQSMGKLGHEKPTEQGARFWTLPWVAPTLVGVAVGARLLDRLLHDEEETLGFLILAKHPTSGSSNVKSSAGERHS
jgi:SAM-dependent methyltransferase